MDWIELAQDWDRWRALVNTLMDLRVSQNFGKFLSIWATGGLTRRTQFHEVGGHSKKGKIIQCCCWLLGAMYECDSSLSPYRVRCVLHAIFCELKTFRSAWLCTLLK
jgi:hypothetical protein